ncbi:hypothetical protein KR074_000808 [Drosophila pseudoananassae]|nr:hypothetical protein KR074_000808 [Drosophila pseudoananassae]
MTLQWKILPFLFYGFAVVVSHFQYHRSVRYSPELVNDLREFGKLIPSVTIDELVAEHMITDSGFRKAIKFLRSSDFKRFRQHTESLPEVEDLINFVHLNDTASGPRKYHRRHSDRHRRWAEEVVVVLLDTNTLDWENLSSFTSFVQDVLGHLPRDRFVALIKAKRQNSAIFAKFYEALKSAEFKTKVEAAWNTVNVQGVIRELSGHGINSQELKTIGFEVLSWGPA